MRCHLAKMRVATLFGLLLVTFGFYGAAYAQTAYVYIYPNKSDHGPGRWFNNQYAGVVKFDIRGNSLGRTSGGQTTTGYCIDYNGAIYLGTEYKVALTGVSDTQEWRQIAYILTWHHPPADNDAGVVVQGALWRILPPNPLPSFLSAYHGEILNLVSNSTGKDIIRKGDIFQWVFPELGNNTYLIASPGETKTLTAQITDATGHPRKGVKVLFSMVSGSGTLNPTIGWTNSSGDVDVKVTPSSTEVRVKAYTRGVWPQYYLDLDGNYQNLIGMDTTYALTVEAQVWIYVNFHVIPELPFGTLGAVATCLSTFVVKRRRTTLK